MKFKEFVWDDDNIAHIARHHVEPKEVEEACFIKPFIQRTRSYKRYFVLGQSDNGRYLAIVVDYQDDLKVKVVTARDMTETERKRYQRS